MPGKGPVQTWMSVILGTRVAKGLSVSIPPEASDATVNKGSKLVALTDVKTSMNAKFLQTRY